MIMNILNHLNNYNYVHEAMPILRNNHSNPDFKQTRPHYVLHINNR